MEKLILKPEIIDAIKKDSVLYGSVAAALKISTYTLPKLLLTNDPRLTQANVLLLIRKHVKDISEDADLLTTEMEPA